MDSQALNHGKDNVTLKEEFLLAKQIEACSLRSISYYSSTLDFVAKYSERDYQYQVTSIKNFEVIDERPRYYFFDVLHLDQESPLGVKVIIKEAILNCGYTVDIKKYLDEIDKPLSINRALTIFADLFFNDALTDILLNNGNFIVEENE